MCSKPWAILALLMTCIVLGAVRHCQKDRAIGRSLASVSRAVCRTVQEQDILHHRFAGLSLSLLHCATRVSNTRSTPYGQRLSACHARAPSDHAQATRRGSPAATNYSLVTTTSARIGELALRCRSPLHGQLVGHCRRSCHRIAEILYL
jgi:hypothetical protein